VAENVLKVPASSKRALGLIRAKKRGALCPKIPNFSHRPFPTVKVGGLADVFVGPERNDPLSFARVC